MLWITLLAGMLLSGCFPWADVRPRPFDAKQWRAARGHSENNVRLAMIDDLITNHIAIGTSRQEVLSLLGHSNLADLAETASERDRTTKTLKYLVGQLYSGEDVALVIEFENDKVTRAWEDVY